MNSSSFRTIIVYYFLLNAAIILNTETQAIPTIQRNPSSLLVPVNTTAEFECLIQNCIPQCEVPWYINGTSTAHEYQLDQHENRGYHLFHHYNTSTRVYTTRLSVTASIDLNNISMYCLVQDGLNAPFKSEQAEIFVISADDLPLTSNPSVSIQNSTSLLLEWSPPFLWPGQRIEYFNISVTNTNDNTITFYTVNTTFEDVVVSLPTAFDYQHDMCTDFLFSVSAISSSSVLPSYSTTARSHSSLAEFSIEDQVMEITVLFTAAATPYVSISISLPSPICLNQDVNYTIIVINNESNLTKHYGPYRHVGPGTVKHDLVSGLERNQEYSVYIEVEISRNVTVVSNDTRFNTYFQDEREMQCSEGLKSGKSEVLYYQVAVGISLSLAAVTILSLILLIVVLLCEVRKKGGHQLSVNAEKCDSTDSHNQNADRLMVHNPIYDPSAGPEYECVDTLPQLNSRSSSAADDTPMSLTSQASHCTALNGNKKYWTSDNYTLMSSTTKMSLVGDDSGSPVCKPGMVNNKDSNVTKV